MQKDDEVEGKSRGFDGKKTGNRQTTSDDRKNGADGRKTDVKQKLKSGHTENIASSSHIKPLNPIPSASRGTKRNRDDDEDVSEASDERPPKKVAAGGLGEHVVDGPWSEDVYKKIAGKMMPPVVRIARKGWEDFCAKPHNVPVLLTENGLWDVLCMFYQVSPKLHQQLDNAFKTVMSKILSA